MCVCAVPVRDVLCMVAGAGVTNTAPPTVPYGDNNTNSSVGIYGGLYGYGGLMPSLNGTNVTNLTNGTTGTNSTNATAVVNRRSLRHMRRIRLRRPGAG